MPGISLLIREIDVKMSEINMSESNNTLAQ